VLRLMLKSDDDNVCEAPRCKKPACVVYLGKKLCDSHWKKLCEDD
jgi:hypothetical protein